jgi:hypothetical protein
MKNAQNWQLDVRRQVLDAITDLHVAVGSGVQCMGHLATTGCNGVTQLPNEFYI